jgi:uncharacterized membrane protein YbhN (UPF0104 family)
VIEELTAAGDQPPQDPPRVRFTRGRLLAFLVVAVSVALFLYFVLPKLLGLRQTWNRIDRGDPWWLAFAAVLEVLSFACYIALFRAVFTRDSARSVGPAGLAGARAIRSRWPRWRQHVCLRLQELGGSR